ncbi:hypothetical protein [Streptomyces europaeiscabiei]|uniref:hypothetical protein n=1 Tax=Streptomyces europaeiscabiei TaxID=146819 RepID=UPI0029BDD331|nr:hypothetical protein [Streptomyces europaeiscabiei]MDX3587733.1 hypothetical protein [Streptomyces europaeiscabiei]MDX3617953.1 hypothetical protein [Streptomyces europaeiscabiei]MDX3631795.1 hypothetical protein [Streptomyces europaeiscabiei]MDX3649576.1 hypothetical protein [Streptomyces europaeiscabiei]WUD34358.1 hypothetical protein OG858_25110 [Streptomyces europaeiscabiei]
MITGLVIMPLFCLAAVARFVVLLCELLPAFLSPLWEIRRLRVRHGMTLRTALGR